MNRPITMTVLAAMALLVGAALPALAADQDALIVRKSPGSDKTTTQTGIIKKDDYTGMTIAVGRAVFSKPRSEVVDFSYGQADMRNFKRGVEAYKSGNYKEALKNLEAATKSISRMTRNEQKPMFGQHCLYYKGMSYYRMGDHENALDSLARLNAQVPDGAWKFEAGYYECRALEQKSRSNAKNKYELRAKEFREIYEKGFKPAMRWAVLCKLSVIRIDLEEAILNDVKDTIEKKLGEVQAFKRNQDVWGVLTSADRAEIVQVEAQALKALGRFEELTPVLNTAIRTAQQDNDHEALKNFYLERANAHWQLYSNAKTEKEKTELADKALTDYLRLDLLFSLGSNDASTANYRLGKCFVEVKTDDWKARAIHHLQKAKSMQRGADSQAAANYLNVVENMEGPGGKEDKTE